jgi:PAS domain S-box-containing protein
MSPAEGGSDKEARLEYQMSRAQNDPPAVPITAGSQHDVRFRALFESSCDGMALTDIAGRILHVNAAFARMLGYAAGELHARTCQELARGAQDAEAALSPDRIVARGYTDEHESEWTRKDGSVLPVSVRAWLVEDDGNRHLGLCWIARDITERKRAERARRAAHADLDLRAEARAAALAAVNDLLQIEIVERQRSEEQLRKLSRAIEETGDSILVTDRHGVIEYVNRSFEALTGYSRDEAVGARSSIVKSGAHDRSFYEALWQTILSGQTFRAVFTNRTKDGRFYHEDQTISPLRDGSGAITHFVSTGRDITRRKRTEEALRRLNDALERETARIAGVLHDEAGQFLTSAHITLADVARDLPAPVRESLQAVRQHLNEIEARLRRLSHELHPRILEDLGLMDAIRFVADGVARRTSMTITVEGSVERRCTQVVETALYRLVQEALTNMVKHARATRGAIVLTQDVHRVQCCIRDDGRGFDVAAVLRQRREPGLGLIGIQDRLEAVGGMLEIVSAPGQGTEVRATIPLEG